MDFINMEQTIDKKQERGVVHLTIKATEKRSIDPYYMLN
jgi:hypothetical protein